MLINLYKIRLKKCIENNFLCNEYYHFCTLHVSLCICIAGTCYDFNPNLHGRFQNKVKHILNGSDSMANSILS